MCALVSKIADQENSPLPPLRQHPLLDRFEVYGCEIMELVRVGGRYRAMSTRITVNQQLYLECMEGAMLTWCSLCEAGAWAMYSYLREEQGPYQNLLRSYHERRPNVMMYIPGIYDEANEEDRPYQRHWHMFDLEGYPTFDDDGHNIQPTYTVGGQTTDFHVLMMLFEDPVKWQTLGSCLEALRAQKLLELAKRTREVSTSRAGLTSAATIRHDRHTANNIAAVDVSALMITLQASLESLDGGDAFENSVERFGKGTISVIYLVAGYFMTRELITAASRAYHEQLPFEERETGRPREGQAERFRRER